MEERAAKLIELTTRQPTVASLLQAAFAAKASGDYERASELYERLVDESTAYLDDALDYNRSFPDSPLDVPPIVRPLVDALLIWADVVASLGDPERSDSLRRRGVEISRLHLGTGDAVDVERSLAASLAMEGRYNEAMVALLAARDAVVAEEDALGTARVAIDLCGLLQWLGDYERAEAEIEHAEKLIQPQLAGRRFDEVDVEAALAQSIASILSGEGDPNAAVHASELYRQAVEVRLHRGLNASNLGKWEEAERHLREVWPEYRKLGTGEAIEFQLVKIVLRQGREAEALEGIHRIAHVFEEPPYRAKRAVLQSYTAECHLGLGEVTAARRSIDESVADLEARHFDPDALWKAQRTKAKVCLAEADLPAAAAAHRAAIGTIDQLRRAPLGYRLDSTFLRDKMPLYSEAIDLAVTTGAAADACRFIESLKSRTLQAVLGIPAVADGESAGLSDELTRLTCQLDTLEYQAYREGWSRERRLEHRALLDARAGLLERIRVSDPRWRALSGALPFDPDATLRHLAERSQAAFTLHYAPPHLHAVLLFDGELRCERLTLTERTTGALDAYAKNLQKKSYDPFANDLSAHESLTASDLLPAPLLSRALAAESLLMVPHRELHLVPWAGLVHEGRRLFERLPVGVLPSLGTLASRRRPHPPGRLSAVGVSSYPGIEGLDLPNARAEIDDVVAAYAAAGVEVAEPLLDEEATEAAFWERGRAWVGDGNVLHMSCHGTLVPREPMSSGLLLADSKVDAAEIAAARLPYDEVVLSACSTGWRPSQVGDLVLDADEILGIPAGFLEGGAESVLVSIPKAEGSSARRLTTHYHARRLAGETPLFAFRAAQRALLADDVPAATWIGFTLYGCW